MLKEEVQRLTTKIFAHRGASMYAPENTMAAFQLADQLGAEGIEIDVHLTKDQVPVIIHDETIDRTTNGTGYIKDYTFNELKSFDAGSWFDQRYTGEQIISLEEFCIWITHKSLYLNIELKNNKIDYKHLESIIYEMLDHYKLLPQTIISTFNVNSLKRMQRLYHHVKRALLTTKANHKLIERAMALDVQAIHLKYSALTTQIVTEAKQHKIDLSIFTVNKPRQMIHCFNKGCRAIFTDVPDLALHYRQLNQLNN